MFVKWAAETNPWLKRKFGDEFGIDQVPAVRAALVNSGLSDSIEIRLRQEALGLNERFPGLTKKFLERLPAGVGVRVRRGAEAVCAHRWLRKDKAAVIEMLAPLKKRAISLGAEIDHGTPRISASINQTCLLPSCDPFLLSACFSQVAKLSCPELKVQVAFPFIHPAKKTLEDVYNFSVQTKYKQSFWWTKETEVVNPNITLHSNNNGTLSLINLNRLRCFCALPKLSSRRFGDLTVKPKLAVSFSSEDPKLMMSLEGFWRRVFALPRRFTFEARVNAGLLGHLGAAIPPSEYLSLGASLAESHPVRGLKPEELSAGLTAGVHGSVKLARTVSASSELAAFAYLDCLLSKDLPGDHARSTAGLGLEMPLGETDFRLEASLGINLKAMGPPRPLWDLRVLQNF